MRVTTAIERPHIVGDAEGQCWCHPVRVACDCGECDGAEVWGHGWVEGRPDVRPRMAAFSAPV